MPISKTHSSTGGNNTGSCSSLANYLEKENIELDKMSDQEKDHDSKMKIESMKQQFFNHEKSDVSHTEVISSIDNNKKKLGKEDAKFFAPTISFSEKEQQQIAKMVSGKNIENIKDLNVKEFKAYNKAIQDYARKAMDNYAKNFNRKDKGLETGKDLVYYGKVEHMRKYKGTDKEVQQGKIKSGEYKKGLQSHVHLIVSRKDKTQKLKLSPMANERNKTRKIGGNEYKVGFDRKEWIQANEKAFDQQFQYKRQEIEKFQNQNILKNGNPSEKAKIIKTIEKDKGIEKAQNSQNELGI
ncbi:DUF5712 family protein [Maribacter sp. Asnod2-G09]|uniref:DUF5712 family protein n=1 Tax=Maribacter sp. Asnod2-G09 TaxID=3160577 RepID=UPI00386A2B94